MKRSLAYLTALLFVAAGGFAVERQFCTVPADCVPDTEAVRFGNPADRNSALRAKLNDEITMLVAFDVKSDKVQGWSMGVKHNPAKLEFIEATHLAPELPLQPADLFFPVTSKAAGTPIPGFITAVVLAIIPPPGKVLPVGDNFPVVKVRYKVIGPLDPNTPTLLEFTDTLNPENSPLTKVNLTVNGKTKRPDKVTDGEIRGEAQAGNTPVGTNVEPALGVPGVAVKFAQVTAAGDTKAVAQDANPSPDANLQFLGKFYDVTTTATSSGNITVTLSYADADIPAGKTEADIDIYHLVANAWQKATTGRDAAANKVSADVQSLSFFALAVVKTPVQQCDDWAFYFGTDPSQASAVIPNDAASFKISMRNKSNALAFSLAVKRAGTNYTLVDEQIGTDAQHPLVDLVITDNTGTDQTPKTNSATGPDKAIGKIERGTALTPFGAAGGADCGTGNDCFLYDLNPGVGGPGFFVAYVADRTAAQTQEIPATAAGTPCPVNEILVVSYGVVSRFRRGDTNGDGRLNVTDGVICARNIFLGANDPKRLLKFDCADMLDANNDGKLDASDPIYLLTYLFLKGAIPPEPFKTCGADTGADDTLGCNQPNCQ